MKNIRGLSDVVTTVVIIALALVAITVVWMVVQNLISSNSNSIDLQQKCIDVGIEVSAVENENNVTISVKRTRGSAVLSGAMVYAYNSTTSISGTIENDIKVGQMVSAAPITIEDVTKVSAVASFKDEEGNPFYCSPVEKVL